MCPSIIEFSRFTKCFPKSQKSNDLTPSFPVSKSNVSNNFKKKEKEKRRERKKSNLLSFRISYIYILPCSDFCNETRGQCSKLIFISLDGESGELSRKGFENDICRYPCLLFCNFSLLCFIISPLLSLSLSRLIRARESPWIFRDTIRTEKSRNERETRERERVETVERKREKEEEKWTNRRATKKKKRKKNGREWQQMKERRNEIGMA